MPDHPIPLSQALDNATRVLLESRNKTGHWEGELSSSALSTATAVFALSTYEQAMTDRMNSAQREQLRAVVAKGIDWLCKHQNPDGGWGDTVISISNISTTALCWAALSVGDHTVSRIVAKAEAWLNQAAGSLKPAKLAAAITARYGKDKTFSVPILTMCALAGRLDDPPPEFAATPNSVGSALADASSRTVTSAKTRPPKLTLCHSHIDSAAWRFVPQLPFELAACPYQWFQWLRLPVVSYALPALIAMGHVRHAHRPTWNLLARGLRRLTKNRTLRVLEQIQPEGGGFLEATPLTSFVVMSLVGSGQCLHPVTANGIDFLIRSIRHDGSWAIDTNLSTWVTTLSINALASHPEFDRVLADADRTKLRDWLLGQQYRVEHPYTHAAPGAWAWTDLPGGVPDADDTAGALLALWNLGFRDADVLDSVNAGVNWLLNLQNRDGGMPTFCRGWGNLPFDRSGSDLTAHALHAWSSWRSRLSHDTQKRIDQAIARGTAYLRKQQRADGAWTPLWFGNQFAPNDENATYGTSRVLTAICAISHFASPESLADDMIKRGAGWLLQAQNPDGGWGAGLGTPSSIEETSLSVQALVGYSEWVSAQEQKHIRDAVERGLDWLAVGADGARDFSPAPIGLYFAKLWYFERLYPSIFYCGALSRYAGGIRSK